MARTSLGRFVLSAGWGSFAVALVTGSIAAAFLGVLLVACTLGARVQAHQFDIRPALPPRAEEGETFQLHIECRTRDATIPLRIRQPLPTEIVLLRSEDTPGRGVARLAMDARADHPGRVHFPPIEVRFQDPWGLVEEVVRIPWTTPLAIAPRPEGLHAGKKAGRRGGLGTRARRRLEADWEPELRGLRDFLPGDRFRDVDWAHSTKLSKLIAREMERHSSMPVVALVQATAAPRRARRMSKLSTIIQAATGVMAAAQSAGLPAGLVAFDDRRVIGHVRASTSRRVLRLALEQLRNLPEAPPLRALHPRQAPRIEAPTAAERAFLEAVGDLDPEAPRGITPLEGALRSVGSVTAQPSLVVCFLDAEETPDLVSVVVSRLQQRGHRCIVVAPASGMHQFAASDVDDAALDALAMWQENRARARGAARKLKAPFYSLRPRVDAAFLAGVLGSAR